MKKEISKPEVKKKIDEFFKRDFSQEELKKIRRLAMKYKIKLKNYRKLYCKYCLSQLRGSLSISRKNKDIYKTITCNKCSKKVLLRFNLFK